jgi:hypothetical protein
MDERLLSRILGLRRVPEDEVGGARGERLVPAHQNVIGAHVAVAHPLDEYRVLQGRALRLASSRS